MLVIGLTGGIGCGKTAVSQRFAALGASVVDTDCIAHALTGPDAAGSRLIAQEFGPAFIDADGRLKRQAMRERVFADPDARRRLEAILHPLIRDEARQQLQDASGPYALLVVPLLAESAHFQALCERILLVDCDELTQIQRVMQRSGLDRDTVTAIIAAQAPRAVRQALAHDIIDNSGPEEDLAARVSTLHQNYVKRACLRKSRE